MTGAMDPRLMEPAYPLQQLIGFRMVHWERDFCRFELPLRESLMNRYGIPHGGIYAVLLDTVMGYAGCFTGDPDRPVKGMTLSMQVNFLSRPRGERMIGEGRRIGGGKRSFFADGQVLDASGELLATGTGVFRYRAADPAPPAAG